MPNVCAEQPKARGGPTVRPHERSAPIHALQLAQRSARAQRRTAPLVRQRHQPENESPSDAGISQTPALVGDLDAFAAETFLGDVRSVAGCRGAFSLGFRPPG